MEGKGTLRIHIGLDKFVLICVDIPFDLWYYAMAFKESNDAEKE
jgi:hypothetical protein